MRRAAIVILGLTLTACNAVFGIEDGHLDEGVVHVEGAHFSFKLAVSRVGVTNAVDNSVSASLSHAFAIDDDEVTVARFQAWTKAGMKPPDDGARLDPGGPYDATMRWNKDWDAVAGKAQFTKEDGCETVHPYSGDTTTDRGGATLPMTCVNWPQAAAFCAFEGKRLPTNVEWQFEAQGGTADVPAPYTEASPTCDVATLAGCGFPVAVGTAKGKTHDGALDMGGSVLEWVWDGIDDDATVPPSQGDRYDGAIGASHHLLRGDAYFDTTTEAVDQNHKGFSGDMSSVSEVGLRCARTLHPAE